MRLRALLLGSCAWLALAAAAAELAPFDEATMAALRAEQAGRPFVLALWSVHCAPCREELPALRALAEQHPAVAVIFVATDPPAEADGIRTVWAGLGMNSARGMAFAHDYVERLRWSIDPKWYGELPRTYLLDADHAMSGHSGRLDLGATERWMAARGGAAH